MRMSMGAAVAVVVAVVSCQIACSSRAATGGRTVTVAQSGAADVVGSDSAALQKAAGMLRSGDTLSIGPGTYAMENSLFVPSGVTVRGAAGKTILLKSRGVESKLAEDGDFGERLLLVSDRSKFHPGMGISVSDDTLKSGWDITVSAVSAIEGPYLRIDPPTVRDYEHEKLHAVMRNTFPILCVMNGANVLVEDIIVDGNKAENAYLDGCRGGAIYMYNVRNVTVRNCTARNYNGDGISFQISDNVRVEHCEAYGQTGYGVHPGTGSAHPVVTNCRMHDNDDIGLFLCWRVRHGKFTDNVMEHNGHYGVSIGHKDTDNEFVNNTIAQNGVSGVYFREETFLNSGHRNTFRNNKVLDNGGAKEGYGFYVAPHATDIVIDGNQIADTRATGRTQRYGVYKLAGAGTVQMGKNTMSGHSEGDFKEAGLPVRASR